MKRSALLQGITVEIVRYCCCAAVVLGGAGAGDCLAVDPSLEHLSVAVEDISYLGNNNYKVEITIYNRSGETIVVKECSETFAVQTEILGRWQELVASGGTRAGGAVLLPRKGVRVAHIVHIPLDLPSLYRNSEGDINMLFKYRVRFANSSGSRLRSNIGESAYWITPKTNTWVLREGM